MCGFSNGVQLGESGSAGETPLLQGPLGPIQHHPACREHAIPCTEGICLSWFLGFVGREMHT